jgi:hypothetical protein
MSPESYVWDGQSVRRIGRTVQRSESETTPRDMSDVPPTRISSGTAVNWQRATNNSGQTIPPYSCVAIGTVSQADGSYRLQMTQPAGTANVQYGLTGPNACELPSSSGLTGLGSFHLESGWATYESSWSGGGPQPGDVCGPKSGQWTLSKSGTGYVVVQLIDGARNIVLVNRGSVGGGGFVCQVSSDIPAMTISGGVYTLGSQSASLWTISNAGVATDTGTAITVWNTTKSAVKAKYGDGTNKLLQGKYINGLAVIDVEDCNG